MRIYQKPKYHERRWRELVEPLVPKDGADRTFLDLGCNAGFYMLKAEKLGYKTIGVEGEKKGFNGAISQAPKHLNIIYDDINYHKPQLSYLANLCCVHYHLTREQIESLFLKLWYRAANVLIMGRHEVKPKWGIKTRPDKKFLLETLGKGWKLVGERTFKKFYTVIVRNPTLREMDVDELYENTRSYVAKTPKLRRKLRTFFPAFEDFVRRSIDDSDYNPARSDFVKYLKNRRLKYRLGRCWGYKVMIEEIKKSGIQSPLTVVDGRIFDGYHRMIILRELGMKRVIVRNAGKP